MTVHVKILSLAATATLLLTSPALAPPVAASAPGHFGPFDATFSGVGFNCDGFDIVIESEGTDSYTQWLDDSGGITRLLYRARYPHDTLTNSVSGKSIVVRAAFNESIERVPGTDEFIKTITGFRYMVNEPGIGVTIRDVGRIIYGDLAQTIVRWQAGEHDLAIDETFQPTFCAALA